MIAVFYAENCENSKVESSAVFADTVASSDGTYIVAGLATGQGPVGLAQASVNAFIADLESMVADSSLFDAVGEKWRAKMQALFNQISAAAYNTGKQTHTLVTVSACATMTTPAGETYFVSSGNVMALIKKTDSSITPVSPLETTATARRSEGYVVRTPDKTCLTSALGLQDTVRARILKATLTGTETVVILSAGFAEQIEAYAQRITEIGESKFIASSLLEHIKKQRGLACGDAVLVIQMGGGGGTGNRTDEAGISA